MILAAKGWNRTPLEELIGASVEQLVASRAAPLMRALERLSDRDRQGFGGLARLIAAAVSGWPHPVFLGALGVELVVVPAVLVWQAKVANAFGHGRLSLDA